MPLSRGAAGAVAEGWDAFSVKFQIFSKKHLQLFAKRVILPQVFLTAGILCPVGVNARRKHDIKAGSPLPTDAVRQECLKILGGKSRWMH